MCIVTHANTFYTGWGKLLFDAEECVLAGVLRHVKQLVFDAQELVVLRHAVRAARRTGLDLAGVRIWMRVRSGSFITASTI